MMNKALQFNYKGINLGSLYQPHEDVCPQDQEHQSLQHHQVVLKADGVKEQAWDCGPQKVADSVEGGVQSSHRGLQGAETHEF